MGDFMGGEGLGWRGEREGWMKNMYHFVGGLSSLWDGGLGTAGHWRVVGKERERERERQYWYSKV